MRLRTFLIKKYWPQIIFALLVFGGLIAASIFKPEWHASVAWLEAIAGLGTLVFAFLLWLNGIRQDWEENLPKRMTVQYQWQGRNVLVCYEALLVSESDARTWALQIGQQMSGCQRLKFEPFFNLQQRGIQTEKISGKKYKGFVFTYFLTELPVPDGVTTEKQDEFRKRLENGCIERYPRYHQDGTISMEDGYVGSSNQKMTISH
jgi:hypothetical protein